MTRKQIETALDKGKLDVAMTNGNWWRVRRNGKTQTWKTRPGEFRVPVKAGLHVYGDITDLNMCDATWRIRDA